MIQKNQRVETISEETRIENDTINVPAGTSVYDMIDKYNFVLFGGRDVESLKQDYTRNDFSDDDTDDADDAANTPNNQGYTAYMSSATLKFSFGNFDFDLESHTLKIMAMRT